MTAQLFLHLAPEEKDARATNWPLWTREPTGATQVFPEIETLYIPLTQTLICTRNVDHLEKRSCGIICHAADRTSFLGSSRVIGSRRTFPEQLRSLFAKL